MTMANDTTESDRTTGEKPLRPSYIQRLPDWIYADARYESMSAGQRWALHCLAFRADDPVRFTQARDNLLGAVCGVDLPRHIGCSRRALTLWMAEFIEAGFVVILCRGNGRLANVVGIPAARGSLDCLQADRWPVARYSREVAHERLERTECALALGGNGCALVETPQPTPLGSNQCASGAHQMRVRGAPDARQGRTECALPSDIPSDVPTLKPSVPGFGAARRCDATHSHDTPAVAGSIPGPINEDAFGKFIACFPTASADEVADARREWARYGDASMLQEAMEIVATGVSLTYPASFISTRVPF